MRNITQIVSEITITFLQIGKLGRGAQLMMALNGHFKTTKYRLFTTLRKRRYKEPRAKYL